MKMKFSIFVILFPFTLSVFAVPHTFLFPPVFDVRQSPFFLQRTLSPLFEIKGTGLYIWRIPMTDTVEYSENYEAYLMNTLFMYWSIKPDLIGSYKYIFNRSIYLESEETYIFLRINRDKECEAFYWTGTNTGPGKRHITARLLIRMIFDLNIQVPKSKLIHLSREELHKESDLFLQIFCKAEKALRVSRLFKVSGEEGQLIMEVPPHYNELDGSNVFVLDRMSKFINIWNPNLNEENDNKTKTASALANRLKKVDKVLIKDNVKIMDKNQVDDFTIFQFIFLKVLYPKYGLSVRKFPMDPSPVTKEEWITARNEHLKLYEYSFDGVSVTMEEIHDRPLRMKHLKPNKAHVMTDAYTGNIFIHIGRNAHPIENEQAMAAGEIINWRSTKDPWQKVTLIYQAKKYVDNLPTHFIINFDEKMSILENYITRE